MKKMHTEALFPITDQRPDPYPIWARALIDRFFGPHMNGQRARLVVTKDTLDNDFVHLGGSAGFIDAIIRGPSFLPTGTTGCSTFHIHAQWLYTNWRQPIKGRHFNCFSLPDDAPPYIPHLAVLCLAWTIDSDGEKLHSNAFYNRLTRIIPNHGLNSSMLKDWEGLWGGLRAWTDSLNGKRGQFQIEALGHKYVGVPLSQVLLTPAKVSNLPELYATTGLADSWMIAVSDILFIRDVLVKNESRTRAALGGMLFNQIKDGASEIGRAVLNRLCEFLSDSALREWQPPFECMTSSVLNIRPSSPSAVRVRLVLESFEHPQGWGCRFGLLGGEPLCIPAEDGWTFKKVDQRLDGLWLAAQKSSQTELINAIDYINYLKNGFALSCSKILDEDGDKISLKFRAMGVRVFHDTGWIGQRLIEDDALPESGGCFLLASTDLRKDLELWLGLCKNKGAIVTDYTLTGLPTGSKLYHLARLESVGENLINAFPEKSIAFKKHKASLYLRGGSQIQGSGNQNLYLPYDPPDVVLIAPPSVRLEVRGATLIDDYSPSTWKVPIGMPGYEQRQFRLEVEPDANQIRISGIGDDSTWKPEVVTFGVSREVLLGANFAEDDRVCFDPLGARSFESGIFGSNIKKSILNNSLIFSSWNFEERNLYLGEPATIANCESRSWCLLESIAQRRQITAQEFRRRCERIINWWPQYAWSDVRWLRALCHVEVERDNRGRIAYIYPVPPQGYLLPWKNADRWLISITGCPTQMQLRKLLVECNLRKVEVYSTDRGISLLPPRWLCCSKDLGSIQLALENAGFLLSIEKSNPIPFCAEVADWASSLDQWESRLNWIDGQAPVGDALFNPHQFRIGASDSFHSAWKLISIVDKLSSKHRWHIISHNYLDPSIMASVPRHAFIVDDSWGKWYSMSIIASEFEDNLAKEEDFKIPLPFQKNGDILDVPASLVFPTILTRALLANCGMPPITLKNGSSFYLSEDSKFVPIEHRPYPGACLRYENIHKKIVETICAKVGAEAISF